MNMSPSPLYQQLEARSKRRRTNPFGWRLYGSWCWFYKGEDGHFKIYKRQPHWIQKPDGRWHRDDDNKQSWITPPFLDVPPTGPCTFSCVPMDSSVASFMRRKFDLCIWRPRSVTHVGYKYWFYHSDHNYKDAVQTDAPVLLDFERRTITLTAPVKVRVFDKNKQKELNRLVKHVRDAVKVRIKLGAFDDLDHIQLDSKFQDSERPAFDHSPLEAMQKVNGEDLQSFYDLIALMFAQHYGMRWLFRRQERFTPEKFMEYFEKWVRSQKERMRKEADVVEYVPQP